MPKNISKLIKKAVDIAYFPEEKLYMIQPNQAFCIRFAELIIKECGKVADKYVGVSEGASSQDLKNHFDFKK